MSFKKFDIQIEPIKLDETSQENIQKAKNILNIDENNLDIFLRIIAGDKTNICVSNLFDIFKLSLYFKIKDILGIINQSISNVNNITDICYILLNRPIINKEEKFFLRFLQIGDMKDKLSLQIDQFFQDSHFLDFPTFSIYQILQGSKSQDLINSNLLYQKIMTSITDNLCLVPFIDVYKLADEQKQELFKAINSINKQCKPQKPINNKNEQEVPKSQSEQNDILKLTNIIKYQKEKYMKDLQEREETIKKLKEEIENLLKNSNNNQETTESSNTQSSEDILKLQKINQKQKQIYLKILQEKEEAINKLKEENENLLKNSNNNNQETTEDSNVQPSEKILKLHNIISDQNKAYLKLKEENKKLQDQLSQQTIDNNNNNIMQPNEKELNELYNLCKKYQSEIERKQMENEEKDEAIKTLEQNKEKYKEAYLKEKDQNDFNCKYIIELQKENENLKEKNLNINSPSSNNTKPLSNDNANPSSTNNTEHPSANNTKLHSNSNSNNPYSITDTKLFSTNSNTKFFSTNSNSKLSNQFQKNISSQNKSYKYHPPTSPKELKRIEIFKENESIVENGFYSYKDKITHSKVTKYIKSDLDKSISNTELISSTYPLKLDTKSLSKHEKLEIFQKIDVWEASTFCEAIYMKKKVSNKVCVLNFASATQPGGGVLNGRNAQEEVLSRQSTLYFSLVTKKNFYQHNKDYYDPFGTDYMIYSPNVLIIRDDNDELIEPVKVSVISAVAVNYSEIKSVYKKGEKDQAVYDKMKNRCRRILKLCLVKGNDVIILGAFGCGVFQNSPKMVSEIFKELLIDESIGIHFKKIVFAIKTKTGTSSEVFQTFKNTLSVSAKKH